MRVTLACVLVAALAHHAAADGRIKELIRGFEREAGSCQKMARGVRVVIERGKPVSGNDKELADDLAELTKAQATVQGHCDELESTLELLKADPSATYKALSKQIDERDKRIRSSRAASRQALAESEPLISRSVLRINKLTAEADAASHLSTREQKAAAGKTDAADKAAVDKAAADKAAADKAAADKAAADKAAATKAAASATKPAEMKTTARFPSGRTAELPGPAEAWSLSGNAETDVADYAFAGATGTVMVRPHAGALTCDQIRASILLTVGREPPNGAEPSTAVRALKPAWVAGWSEGDTRVRIVCVPAKGGVVVGRTESSVVGAAQIETALARMLAASQKR